MERSKKRKRRKIKRNKERQKAQKKLQRGRREQRETEIWTKILSTAVEVEKMLEKRPLDHSGVDWTLAQLKLLAKGKNLSHLPHKVDRVLKYKDFMAFARKLWFALYFSTIREEKANRILSKYLSCSKCHVNSACSQCVIKIAVSITLFKLNYWQHHPKFKVVK